MTKRLKASKRLRIPKNNHEDFLHEKGFEIICGLDEVGRGAWAGPLVAGAVILNRRLYGLRDSKLLTAKEREKLARKIRKSSKVGIGEVSIDEVNKLKLTKATQLAFLRAIKKLRRKPDYVLVDGFHFDSPIPCRPLKKGDMICSSIAAASIVAKVYRDKLMRRLDKKIKGYHFSKHKGYGTKLHQERLKKQGISEVHRRFFRNINCLTEEKN
jgi:ribonuclease HII